MGRPVNISAWNLLDLGFPDILSYLLAASDFPSPSLILEITETNIMSDPDLAHYPGLSFKSSQKFQQSA